MVCNTLSHDTYDKSGTVLSCCPTVQIANLFTVGPLEVAAVALLELLSNTSVYKQGVCGSVGHLTEDAVGIESPWTQVVSFNWFRE